MEAYKPHLALIIIQFIYAGNNLISKAALDGGMNSFVFTFYRQAIATLFLAPFAIFLERKRAPPLSFTILVKIFLLSLIGVSISLTLYVIALDYTSATLTAAVTNGLPVITFVIALLTSMEIVNLRSSSGKAKAFGIAVCVAGIVTLAVYRGPPLNFLNHDHPFYHETGKSHQTEGNSSTAWIKGTILMFFSVLTWALWLVMQAPVLESYPSKLLLTVFQCLFSTIQIGVGAAAWEHDLSKWKLRLDIQLFSVIYCGIFVTGITFWLQAWGIEKKGPVFTAMFMPLSLLITMALSGLILGELITWGSVLGGVLMVVGLYCVLWGKSRENADSKLVDEQDTVCLEGKETGV